MKEYIAEYIIVLTALVCPFAIPVVQDMIEVEDEKTD